MLIKKTENLILKKTTRWGGGMENYINFIDKVALITGAGSGIGRATAYEFAEAGAKVVIADIAETGEETRDYIIKKGNEAIFVKCDVTKMEEHQGLLNEIIKQYHKIDFAFNNAGIEQTPNKLAEIDENTWDNVIEVNLKGVWLGMKSQIPFLIKNGGGVIINTASVAGLKALADSSAYASAKAAVAMLSRTAAVEYAKQNIRINVINPGLVMTEMVARVWREHPEYFETILDLVPMGRAAEPSEIAKIVVWLCSEAASYITGQCIVADGGWLA